jgi:hypothetical protein
MSVVVIGDLPIVKWRENNNVINNVINNVFI